MTEKHPDEQQPEEDKLKLDKLPLEETGDLDVDEQTADDVRAGRAPPYTYVGEN